MCEICGINMDQLAACYESYESVGTLLPKIAEELGLSADVKVAAGAGEPIKTALALGLL